MWWREARPVVEVPRRHAIGWCHVTGQPHGRLEIPSPHFRLDRRQIETALTAHLADQHPTSAPPQVAPAYLVEDQLTIGARLRVAGHRIVERDLVTAYGLQVVGGVIATLLGQGVDATIVCDRALSHPVRRPPSTPPPTPSPSSDRSAGRAARGRLGTRRGARLAAPARSALTRVITGCLLDTGSGCGPARRRD